MGNEDEKSIIEKIIDKVTVEKNLKKVVNKKNPEKDRLIKEENRLYELEKELIKRDKNGEPFDDIMDEMAIEFEKREKEKFERYVKVFFDKYTKEQENNLNSKLETYKQEIENYIDEKMSIYAFRGSEVQINEDKKIVSLLDESLHKENNIKETSRKSFKHYSFKKSKENAEQRFNESGLGLKEYVKNYQDKIAKVIEEDDNNEYLESLDIDEYNPTKLEISEWKCGYFYRFDKEVMEEYTLSNKIQKFMDKLDITQEELCTATGISRSTLSEMINSKRKPSLESAYRIAKAFGVTIESIFEFDESLNE